MQTVLKEVGEVVYFIDTWFITLLIIAFGVIMFRILFNAGLFFQIQFVYLASYLLYPKILKTLNDFFCHLLFGQGVQNVHAP